MPIYKPAIKVDTKLWQKTNLVLIMTVSYWTQIKKKKACFNNESQFVTARMWYICEIKKKKKKKEEHTGLDERNLVKNKLLRYYPEDPFIAVKTFPTQILTRWKMKRFAI